MHLSWFLICETTRWKSHLMDLGRSCNNCQQLWSPVSNSKLVLYDNFRQITIRGSNTLVCGRIWSFSPKLAKTLRVFLVKPITGILWSFSQNYHQLPGFSFYPFFLQQSFTVRLKLNSVGSSHVTGMLHILG